eukprot:5545507-Karenia_brevis.AAC.1
MRSRSSCCISSRARGTSPQRPGARGARCGFPQAGSLLHRRVQQAVELRIATRIAVFHLAQAVAPGRCRDSARPSRGRASAHRKPRADLLGAPSPARGEWP